MNAIPPLLLAAGLALAAPVQAQLTGDAVAFSIERKRLPEALAQWSRVTGLQVISQAEVVRTLTANPVMGTHTPMEALRLLLANMPLTFSTIGENTVVIEPMERNASAPKTTLPLQRLAAAQTPAPSVRLEPARVEQPIQEEVIVTAQKRSERLQDVPVPVAAITATALVETNRVRLQDYYERLPGVNFTLGTRGEPSVAIRGITTGAATPTVGLTVDDVPYGTSTNLGGGYTVPDLDPSDLERIEVLRGPQGTLYGASSMGGLIKYVTKDPSTDALSGRLQMGAESIENGDGLGGSVRGSVNVPVTDELAIRASGFMQYRPGYVDNVQTGEQGVNERKSYGGRLAALWRPSQDLSIKFSGLMQDINTLGSQLVFVRPGLTDLQQSTLRGTGSYHTKNQAYGLTVATRFGDVDFTSVTGYTVNDVLAKTDYSSAFGALVAPFGVTGSPLIDDYTAGKFTQEIRLSAPIGDHFEWLLGGFYTDERTRWHQSILAADQSTGNVVGAPSLSNWLVTYSEYALFGDLTIKFSERFDVQIGGRATQNRQTFEQVTLSSPSNTTTVIPRKVSEDEPFTYLLTPRFRISPDLMVYARVASGYRAGGINASGAVVPTYKPDKTNNYELGVKGSAFQNTLTYDVSLYHILWEDLQLNLLNAQRLVYVGNASEAKSQGVELSIEAAPFEGFTVNAAATYNDAELSKSFPSTSTLWGASGDRLPYSSRFSGSLTAQQRFALTDNMMGFVGASLSHIGDRLSVFQGSSGGSPLPRQEFPAYTKYDLRAGVELDDSWTANLFVNNVTDKRGVVQGGIGFRFPFAFQYIEPRSIGLTLAKSF
ncbi:TonB-dependent receptor domain-containing protein [Steroidobacter cummioxidans]|uniref:TonB-dependent receptor domain-containing protein n=1 Tax=Steroidobacter cummioxidans TaxID=1803913 RepID=UPI000E3170AF|nr:TonB-dependent receptor [Steroidobacter cummioxidans]